MAFSGKDSMFVTHIMGWYLSEVQEGLKSGDWEKADEVIGMIHTYQQAKNKTVDIALRKYRPRLNIIKWMYSGNVRKGT